MSTSSMACVLFSAVSNSLHRFIDRRSFSSAITRPRFREAAVPEGWHTNRTLYAIIPVITFLVFASIAAAQQTPIPARITQAIDPANMVVLKGNVHPLAQAQFDRGPAPSSLALNRMLLVLKRSPDQEAALESLLDQQQDKSSPNFHKWLTPQQFGQQFGPADQDIQAITSWLQSYGFQVAGVSQGRTVIEFSGTAGQLQQAFHTTIHKYSINRRDYWANSTDPQIPAALSPVVAGINTLYNFPRRAMHEVVGVVSRNKATRMVTPAKPLFTLSSSGCGIEGTPECFAVGPADFAKIYDVPNLLLSPAPTTQYNGDGETIAVLGESDINTADVAQFRALFGLPALKSQQLNVIVSGPDPGIIPGVETEADLDIQWSGAVAPNATIDFVIAEPTEVSLGVDLAAQYAVDNNLADVINESFGICEFFMGAADNTFYNQLWQQAAAQGTTVTVSSGDGGSAACDQNAGTQGPAIYGLSVSGFTSTPYNVSVGGTDFNDLTTYASFWNTAPSDTPTTPSARGYVPEMTWNDTCTNQEVFSFFSTTGAEQTCNSSGVTVYNPFLLVPVGGSGGKSSCINSDGANLSSCTRGYAKPAWQTAGTPNDNARDVPDVSLFASPGFNGSFYLICESDLSPGSSSCDPNSSFTDAVGIGGTSASSPAFAGIMALVDQAKGSRQGNANYVLYKMARQSGYTCTSVANPASSCVFYDMPSGSTIAMPCASGRGGCTSSGGDLYGVLSGYATASGYDRATGLGSVNATNLISKWTNFPLTPSSTSLTLTPPSGSTLTTLTHGQAVSVSTTVTGSGSPPPSGTVALIANEGANGAAGATDGVQSFVLSSSGTASGSTNALPGGSYTVFASYPGDGTFGSSSSSPAIPVTVNAEKSKVQIANQTYDPTTGIESNPNATTAVFGTPTILRVNVTSAAGDACPNNAPGDSGCPTGSITLTDAYNGGSAAPLDGGTFALNPEGYTEDQSVEFGGALDLPGGTHNIAAAYPGDSSFSAPASPSTDTLTITPVGTSTGFSYVPTNASFGSTVSLSATMSAQLGYSNIAPTGTITFMANGTTSLGSAPIQSCGQNGPNEKMACASIATTALPHGQDSVTAVYNGDASYATSTSSPATVSVLYATTGTLTSSNLSIQATQSVTFTANVTSSQSGGPAISGTVQFQVNGVNAGSPVAVQNGQAQFTTSTLRAGLDSVAAVYSGDTNYQGSTTFVTETVSALSTTIALSSSNTTIQQGSNVTFTATLTPQGGSKTAPTGTVQFTANGQNIGNPAISSNQAQLTTNSLPSGSVQISATYSGDSFYSTSSGTLTETVTPTPTFTITDSSPAVTVASPGQSGSTTLTFTAQNGFTGTATLTSSACSNLPSETTCSFSPSTVTFTSSTTSVPVMMTVTTTAPSATVPFARWLTPGLQLLIPALVLLTMLVLSLLPSRRRRVWSAVLALVALGIMTTAVGCGGGGGGGFHNPGTPTGNYTGVTVTVTIGSVTQSINTISVNVE